MLILAAAMIILALLLLAGAAVWLTAGAFRESLAWGLCALLVPGAALVFMFAKWERGKPPFFCVLGAVFLLLGSWSVVTGYERHGGKLPDFARYQFLTPAPPAKSGVADEGIFKAKKDAELQIRLVNLQTRETELLQRKAELRPGDHAGAAALTAEIKKYNDELQPVLLQLKAK